MQRQHARMLFWHIRTVPSGILVGERKSFQYTHYRLWVLNVESKRVVYVFKYEQCVSTAFKTILGILAPMRHKITSAIYRTFNLPELCIFKRSVTLVPKPLYVQFYII